MKAEQAEVIECGECGAIFAACVDGHQDSEWRKELKNYVKRGDKSYFVGQKEFKFSPHTCSLGKPTPQPKIENQLELF